MRIFCILAGGPDTASSRERVLRYLPSLQTHGIDAATHVAGDVGPGLAGRLRYWARLARHLGGADGVLIQRVALSASERALLRASRVPVVFDVDDAIWYDLEPAPDGSPVRSRRWNDLMATIRLSTLVRTGNRELAGTIEPLGLRTSLAPTCAPPVAAGPPSRGETGPITIGWIGHSSNFRYFSACAAAIRDLARERPGLRLRIVADRPPDLEGVPVEFVRWSRDREADELRGIDIGIMPLLDTPSARGKCGYKLLLYMSHGLPVVASPVGVNSEIVEDGRNGFLARTPAEWKERLRELVDRPERRAALGRAGLATVEGRFDHETGLRRLVQDLRDAFRPRPAKERRRVTMLLFFHPPLGGSGSARNSAMARRLRERGWEPAVVTASRWPTYFRDATIEHVPPAVRAAAFDPGVLALLGLRGISFPDRMLPWAAAALPEALRLARSSAALYSSSPPESSHLLAWLLKKITRLPWIADQRNEWTDNPARRDPPGVLALHRRLERFVMAGADRIMTLSPDHTRLLQTIYPRPDRVSTVWTGWEPREAKPPALRPRGPAAIVLFTGMFYGVQRPDPFLDAVERAKLGDMEFHILGHTWDSSERLRRSTVPVRHLGRVPRAETLERMREADFLLVTLTDRAEGVVPGKVFEYAAAGRPILAVVPPEGEVARWVRETRTGFVIPCGPPDAAAAALRDLFSRWRAGTLDFRPDAEALSRYSAAAMAAEVDRILRAAIASR